jgi:arylsulfatase A
MIRYALLLAVLCSALSAATLPNIVIVFIDDMGYADIEPFGSTYKTPHLDRMAKEGRMFTDFYVTQAVCSASRAGLMTGSYNVRVGVFGAFNHRATTGINANEMTLGEVCKQKGYATAAYGKWHLGHHEKFLPLQHGFDDYYGLPYSNDMWPYHPERPGGYPPLPLIAGNRVIDPKVDPEDQRRLTTNYTEHAVAFIERNKDRPFFLYLPHSMVHVPLFVSDKFKGKSGAGLYGDVVQELDWSMGEIFKTLRKHQIDDNTLVIFTSDNGPWLSYGDHAGSPGIFREGKGTMWEGGCREPTLMWWPGKIPAGTKCSEPAMTIDILPTVAKLIGAKLPDHKIDGMDIWPLMAGEAGAKSPQEAYYMYYGRQLMAVRMGDWKLVFPHQYRTLAGRPGGVGGMPVLYEQAKTGLALYNLIDDPRESTDVKAQHPEIVSKMNKLADGIRAELGDSALQIEGNAMRPVGAL